VITPSIRIDELPFRQRPPLELLHLDEERHAPDAGYAGFGWCRVAAVELADAAGARSLADAVIVAVHTPDDAEPVDGDLELEFELEPGGASVTVLLSDFLVRWLPRLRGDARAIVLCACNPHRTSLPRPLAAGATPLWYAHGDVESWLDEDGRLRLVAGAWKELR